MPNTSYLHVALLRLHQGVETRDHALAALELDSSREDKQTRPLDHPKKSQQKPITKRPTMPGGYTHAHACTHACRETEKRHGERKGYRFRTLSAGTEIPTFTYVRRSNTSHATPIERPTRRAQTPPRGYAQTHRSRDTGRGRNREYKFTHARQMAI